MEGEQEKDIQHRPTLPIKTEKVLRTGGLEGKPMEPLEPRVSIQGHNQDKIEIFNLFATRTSGRSLMERKTHNTLVWGGDEKGDIYGARDLKGSRNENPKIQFYDISPHGFRVVGMMDSVGLNTSYRVSNFLRNKGLPTERITHIYKLKEVRDPDSGKMPIDSWKIKARSKFLRENPNATEKEKGSLLNFLFKEDFFVAERELQTGFRLRDIAGWNEEEFNRNMNDMFRWLGVATKSRKCGLISDTEAPEKFNIESEEDIKRYFGEWLPEQMGIYLGRMCKLDIASNSIHAQNWSAVGTLYDLDSFTGKSIGSRENTYNNFKTDVLDTLGSIEELFTGSAILDKYKRLKEKAKGSFIDAYTKEKYGKELTIKEINDLQEYFKDNSYFDGKDQHSIKISNEEWRIILEQIEQQRK